jgi:hypothetical protein
MDNILAWRVMHKVLAWLVMDNILVAWVSDLNKLMMDNIHAWFVILTLYLQN